MIKLDTICNRLDNIIEKLENQIVDIYRKADAKGREPTEKEEERIGDIIGEIDAICIALDHLREYCKELHNEV